MSKQTAPTVLIPHSEIEAAVSRLASMISKDFRGKNPVVIGVLKGSFIFMADLVRRFDFPLEIEFVRFSSYEHSSESNGHVKVIQGLACDIKGRDVLVVEDIIDTGLTTSYFLKYLAGMEPASVKICALLDKPSRRKTFVPIDYLGFTVPDRFIVGYGLDWDQKFRNLPDICSIEVQI